MHDSMNLFGSVFAIMATLGIPLATVGVPIYFIVRFLRAYERRTSLAAVSPESGTRVEALALHVAALETQIDALHSDVARLTESQQFTTKLLEQRATAAP